MNASEENQWIVIRKKENGTQIESAGDVNFFFNATASMIKFLRDLLISEGFPEEVAEAGIMGMVVEVLTRKEHKEGELIKINITSTPQE
ncbi:hypothetical protein [Carboxydothermus ferrireducens]|uniref:Uncharacterized protein n=1 Tax=Carboxydothermus ferrireducens DSM 11255 TaxID=1119529 RepID=A0ABX2R883_9THEO|nr:hypothetical protein [Carboxydothermus ferrireducens]NYE57129.1 hypothetical protein [Carboxydothermus ferrireducens DSM 11255]